MTIRCRKTIVEHLWVLAQRYELPFSITVMFVKVQLIHSYVAKTCTKTSSLQLQVCDPSDFSYMPGSTCKLGQVAIPLCMHTCRGIFYWLIKFVHIQNIKIQYSCQAKLLLGRLFFFVNSTNYLCYCDSLIFVSYFFIRQSERWHWVSSINDTTHQQ